MCRKALTTLALGTSLLAGHTLAAYPGELWDEAVSEGRTALPAQFKPVSIETRLEAPASFPIPPDNLLVLEYVNARLICSEHSTETTAVTITIAVILPDDSERTLTQMNAARQTAPDGSQFYSASNHLTQYAFPQEQIIITSRAGCRGSVHWAGRLLVYD